MKNISKKKFCCYSEKNSALNLSKCAVLNFVLIRFTTISESTLSFR